MKFPYKHVCFDVETTDVDPIMGETFSAYIKPITRHRNPKAMEVNKITEEQLAGAQPMEIVLPMFETFAMQVGKRPVLSAWASYFDVPFLKAAFDTLAWQWLCKGCGKVHHEPIKVEIHSTDI